MNKLKLAISICPKMIKGLFFSTQYRRCRGCRKRRSVRSNSFLKGFLRVPLGKLLKTLTDEFPGTLVWMQAWYVRLQNVCSRDLQARQITPFGGPGAVVKCDESKFYYKFKIYLLFSIFVFMIGHSNSEYPLLFTSEKVAQNLHPKIIVIVTRINEFWKNNFFVLYFLTVLVILEQLLTKPWSSGTCCSKAK